VGKRNFQSAEHHLKGPREQVILHLQPQFFSVAFQLPPEVRDKYPASRINKYRFPLLMRFFKVPSAGDLITHDKFTWRVTGFEHLIQRRGSPNQDYLPVVQTEFVGTAKPGRPDQIDLWAD
jgi:hypothetical protein